MTLPPAGWHIRSVRVEPPFLNFAASFCLICPAETLTPRDVSGILIDAFLAEAPENRQMYRSGHNEIDSKSRLAGSSLQQNSICRCTQVVVRGSTRNALGQETVAWVRLPPSAPKAAPCGVLLFIFAANYARAARWDSNSPCPALCVPPGKNAPVGHF